MAKPQRFSLPAILLSALRLAALALVSTLALAAFACALYHDDRCFVEPEEYAQAREIFMATGSLDLVQKRLTDLEWERPKINETMYRLNKEFEVLPEGALAPKRPEASAVPAKRP